MNSDTSKDKGDSMGLSDYFDKLMALDLPGERILELYLSASMARKKAQAMSLIERVEKSAFNSFDKYHYATADDVLECVRPALGEVGLSVRVNVKNIERTSYETNKNSSWRFYMVRLEYELTDSDTGGKESSTIEVEAADRGDKGLFKAYTMAAKYWCRGTFFVSTGDGDVESDEKVSKEFTNARPESRGSRGGSRRSRSNRPASNGEVAGVGNRQSRGNKKRRSSGGSKKSSSNNGGAWDAHNTVVQESLAKAGIEGVELEAFKLFVKDHFKLDADADWSELTSDQLAKVRSETTQPDDELAEWVKERIEPFLDAAKKGGESKAADDGEAKEPKPKLWELDYSDGPVIDFSEEDPDAHQAAQTRLHAMMGKSSIEAEVMKVQIRAIYGVKSTKNVPAHVLQGWCDLIQKKGVEPALGFLKKQNGGGEKTNSADRGHDDPTTRSEDISTFDKVYGQCGDLILKVTQKDQKMYRQAFAAWCKQNGVDSAKELTIGQLREFRDTLREYPVGTTGAEPVRREYLEQLLATLDGESGDDEVEEASDESGPEDEEQAQTSDAAA